MRQPALADRAPDLAVAGEETGRYGGAGGGERRPFAGRRDREPAELVEELLQHDRVLDGAAAERRLGYAGLPIGLVATVDPGRQVVREGPLAGPLLRLRGLPGLELGDRLRVEQGQPAEQPADAGRRAG